MGITHSKVSEATEGSDASKVRTSDWNAAHVGSNLTVSDTHGVSVAGVTEIRFASLWLTDLGSGVVSLNTYADFNYPVTFTYASTVYDGVFNAMGVQAGSGTFVNPHPSKVTHTQSSNQDGARTADKATDHNLDGNSNCVHTGNSANSWWKVDFGTDRTFAPTKLAIVGRSSGGQHPRNFKLQGSSNNSSWTDLLTVTGDGPNDGTWWTGTVTGSSTYRYLRIYQTGANSSGADYLVMGEVEMWGVLS